MYDVIGDVHGQGAKLRELLDRMGYVDRAGAWHAPEGRQAVFVGDLIDRGPEQLEVLDVVRRMVDAGQARVVLGNHEFNAIAFAVRAPETGDYLRPRSARNRDQHAAFLAAVGMDSPRHGEWVDWFRGLPMALDLGGLRVAHAWWSDAARQCVTRARAGEQGTLDDERMVAMVREPSLKAARKLLTCGVEWDLPAGCFIRGRAGERHGEIRLAVWRHSAERLRDMALVPPGNEDAVPDIAVPEALRTSAVTGAPILFGHHWFSGTVALESEKVACLDWSAAKGGPLVAYRWEGEHELSSDHLVMTGSGLR